MVEDPGAAGFWFVGRDPVLRDALVDLMAGPVRDGLPDAPGDCDVVVLQACGDPGPLAAPGGNAFSACRALKDLPGVQVFLVMAADDRFGAEIARFCMADGCLTWDGCDLGGVEEMRQRQVGHRPRVSVDALLQRLEQEMAADSGRRASAIERLIHHEREDTLVSKLSDSETGLFDGPYASHKLDEEFKRAMRFHQPLSLILLDIGVEATGLPADASERRTFLAEVSSVFLNECRDIDILSRFTETTFLFLLPGTGLDGARTLAHRMLDALATRDYMVPIEPEPRAGVVTVPAAGISNRRAFLGVAEACLRRAQAEGGEEGLCASWE